jgi:hypothetical protein
MGLYQQGFSEFNTVVKLPRPVTPEIFTTSIHRAIGLIESAVGGVHPIVEYLRREPPIPMFDKEGWQKHLGRIIAAGEPHQHSRIEVRPDLVFFPLIMVSVLAHEATHALDPSVCEAVQVAEELRTFNENERVYQEKFYTWKELERGAELRAVEAEIDLLPRLVLPNRVLEEQAQYFLSQRAAVMAMRLTEMAHLEAGLAMLQFSRGLNTLIDDELINVSDKVVAEAQALMEFLLNKPNSPVLWAERAVVQFNVISSNIVSSGQLNHRVENLLHSTSNTLENSRKKLNENVWLASKVKMPTFDL